MDPLIDLIDNNTGPDHSVGDSTVLTDSSAPILLVEGGEGVQDKHLLLGVVGGDCAELLGVGFAAELSETEADGLAGLLALLNVLDVLVSANVLDG